MLPHVSGGGGCYIGIGNTSIVRSFLCRSEFLSHIPSENVSNFCRDQSTQIIIATPVSEGESTIVDKTVITWEESLSSFKDTLQMCADAGILTVHGGGGGAAETTDKHGRLGYGCDFGLSVNHARFLPFISSYATQGAAIAKAFEDASVGCSGQQELYLYQLCVCPRAQRSIQSILGSDTPKWVARMC
jgi:hypothetical protein